MNSGIYKWTNKETGNIYIGQAIDLLERQKQFLNFKQSYAGEKIDEERKLYPSLKYWNYDVLEECNSEQLDIKEKEYILKYNITDKEHLLNIAIVNNNNIPSKKQKEKIILVDGKLPLTKEHKNTLLKYINIFQNNNEDVSVIKPWTINTVKQKSYFNNELTLTLASFIINNPDDDLKYSLMTEVFGIPDLITNITFLQKTKELKIIYNKDTYNTLLNL